MKLVCVLSLVVVFFCSVEGFWNQKIVSRDCIWGQWIPGLCYYKGNGRSVRTLRRLQIKKIGNGKDCPPGPASKEEPCETYEYIVHTFLKTISEPSITPKGFLRGVDPDRIFKSRNPCSDPFEDNGGTRMIGKACESQKQTTRHKRQASSQVRTLKQRDVLFLVDESGSVGSSNFPKEMRFAKAVADSMCGSISIGRETTRIGITTFNRKTHEHLDFDKYFDKRNIGKFMNNMRYNSRHSGSTCVVKALNYTISDKFIPEKGSRVLDPTRTERLIIMITDGCANCEGENDSQLQAELKYAAKALSKKQISVITVYIAASWSAREKERCMKNMAALADGSHCYQVFKADSWAELDKMSDSIVKQNCMDAWTIGETCS